MANGDLIRFRQGTRNDVAGTAIDPGQLLFATYDDEILTASGATTIVQGDIYFDLDSSTRVNIANDVDKARTLFAGACNSADINGQWNISLDGIQQLYDGLTIVIRLNADCTSQYTTLNVNRLGPKLVWSKRNTRLTEGVENGQEVMLVYRTNAGSYTVPQANYGLLTTGATVRDGWVLASSAGSGGGIISTAYSDAAAHVRVKAAVCQGYTPLTNSYVHYTNVYDNTYANSDGILINIGGTGSHPLYINGTVSSDTNCTFPAGTYIMYYDGTNYHVRTDGLLPGAGTVGSAAHATTADRLSANGNILTDLASDTPVSYVSGGNIRPGVTGVLSVLNGGTGRDVLTLNATLLGNGVSGIKQIASANGAYYATATNAEPQFGILPVAQGGTGVTSLDDLYKNFKLWSLGGGTEVAANANLNSYITVGNYYCSLTNIAKTVLNNPYSATASNSMVAFTLKVINASGDNNNYIRQELFEYNKNTRYVRYTTDGGTNWSNWNNVATYEAGNQYAPIYINAKGLPQEISNVDIVHGGTGNTRGSLTGNRVIYSKSSTLMDEAASLYTTGENLAVNKTSITSGYTFEVNGLSHFVENVVADKNVSAKTFTVSSIVQEAHLAFSRSGNYNYITVPANTTSSSLAIGDGAASVNTWVRFHSTAFQPERNNEMYLGTNGSRWKTIYSVDGNYSGKIDADGNITTQSDLTALGDLSITGNSTLNGTLLVKKTARVNNILTIYRESQTSENFEAGIKFQNKDLTTGQIGQAYINVYNCHAATNGDNAAMVINPTGSLFVGGGEAPINVYNAIKPANNENLYLVTDGTNYIESTGNETLSARTGIAINKTSIYPVIAEVATNDIMTIGTSNNRFNHIYVNNASINNLRAISSNTLYFTDSNNNNTIEIYTVNNNQYIAPTVDDKGTLGTTGQRWHSIYVAGFEPDYQVTKSIIITQEWKDIDITASFIPNGTNIVQIYDDTQSSSALNHYMTYWSGIFSWYNDTTTTSTNDAGRYSEIPLHGAGHAINSKQIYLRIAMPAQGKMKLQIKSNFTATAASSLIIKIKHIM